MNALLIGIVLMIGRWIGCLLWVAKLVDAGVAAGSKTIGGWVVEVLLGAMKEYGFKIVIDEPMNHGEGCEEAND